VSKDPTLNKASNTKQNLYVAELTNPSNSRKHIKTTGFEGATNSPVFSPDGKHLAFFAMRRNGYESDKNQIVIYDVTNDGDPNVLFGTSDHIGKWDRSPSALVWSGDVLLVTASDNARVNLFSIPLDIKTPKEQALPKNLFSGGSVGGESYN
jgi:dipeptidyl aminopeptidase/acylaminoacyl peptidase